MRRFLQSGRSRLHFAVIQEGQLQEGDSIGRGRPSGRDVTIADIARLYTTERENVDLLCRVVAFDSLGESWWGYFLRQLEKITSQPAGGPRP